MLWRQSEQCVSWCARFLTSADSAHCVTRPLPRRRRRSCSCSSRYHWYADAENEQAPIWRRYLVTDESQKNKNNNSLLLGSFCTFSLLNRLAERRHHWLRGDSCRITVRVISLEILATSNVDLPAISFMFLKTFFLYFFFIISIFLSNFERICGITY